MTTNYLLSKPKLTKWLVSEAISCFLMQKFSLLNTRRTLLAKPGTKNEKNCDIDRNMSGGTIYNSLADDFNPNPYFKQKVDREFDQFQLG